MKKQKLRKIKKIFWGMGLVLFMIVGLIGVYRIILLIFFFDKDASLYAVIYWIVRSVINISIGVLGFVELKKKYILKRYLKCMTLSLLFLLRQKHPIPTAERKQDFPDFSFIKRSARQGNSKNLSDGRECTIISLYPSLNRVAK